MQITSSTLDIKARTLVANRQRRERIVSGGRHRTPSTDQCSVYAGRKKGRIAPAFFNSSRNGDLS
jgi:hypothetical protein